MLIGAAAVAALMTIKVSYEDLPVVAGIEQALKADAPALFEHAPPGIVPPYGEGASAFLRPRKNVCYQFNYATGNAEEFKRCDHIFEDEFHFSRRFKQILGLTPTQFRRKIPRE